VKRVIELLSFYALSLPIAALPYGLARKAGGLLGLSVHSLWRSRRRIALENVRETQRRNLISSSASPEEIVRDNFRHLGLSLMEAVKVYYGLGDRMVKEIPIEGMEHFERAREKGRGVIFITGHCGNWELMALAHSLESCDFGLVARPLDNPYLNKVLERTRRRFGCKVIYKRGALRAIIKTLKAGGSVGILMDQAVLADEGVIIDFLGRPAWTTRTPVALARRTGAPLLPAFIRRTGEGHAIRIYPEVELTGDDTEDTRRLSGFIEDYIRENPTQWLWMHRRWKRAPQG
jgi:KDO2-lipid IV(A) lauroyltransferase